MAGETDAKRLDELQATVTKLTNMVEKLTATRPAASDITAEEMRAFQKVRDMMAADWGEFCGINDCFQCIIQRCTTRCFQRCVRPCDVECSCGPCSPGGPGGGIRRFRDLGE